MTATELKNMLSEIEHSLTEKYVKAIVVLSKKKIEEVNGKFEMNIKTAPYFNTMNKIEFYYEEYSLLYIQCRNSTDPEDFKLLRRARKRIWNEWRKIEEK